MVLKGENRMLRNRVLVLMGLVLLLGVSVSAQTNLALNKPASSSSVYSVSSFLPPGAVDGSIAVNSRWASVYTASTNPAGEWLKVDLGASFTLTGFVIRWEVACAKAYDVQVSSDNVTWKSVYSYSGATCIPTLTDNQKTSITDPTAVGRYVRVLCKSALTQFGYSIIEFEVYGASGTVPPPPPPPPSVLSISNIAINCAGAVTTTTPGISYPLNCTAIITLSNGTVMAPLKFAITLLP